MNILCAPHSGNVAIFPEDYRDFLRDDQRSEFNLYLYEIINQS